MTDEAETRELAQRFFDAVEAGDIDTVQACYTDDAVIWHNFDNNEQSVADNVAALRGMVSRIDDRSYADRRVETFDGGFVQQHVLHATRKDGERLTMPAVVICKLRDGRIARLDEYLDSAHVSAFRKTVHQ